MSNETEPQSAADLFQELRRSEPHTALVVGSSPRAPELLEQELSGHSATNIGHILYLNSAVALHAACDPDLAESIRVWSIANDWRLASGIAQSALTSMRSDVTRLWTTNVKGSNFLGLPAQVVPLRYLGDVGFSSLAERGIYSGYTVAYTACQLLLRFGVSHARFIGVDLSYGSSSVQRFYGGINADADFHVLVRQVESMRYGIERLRKAGISVSTPEPAPKWWLDGDTACTTLQQDGALPEASSL